MMAFLGSELPIGALLNSLQTNLDEQLDEIVTERNSDITFVHDDADAWFDVSQEEFTASQVQIEVFERDGDFPLVESDASSWPSAPGQLHWRGNFTVRLRHANRHASEATRSQMMKLTRRYLAAIVRVIRDDADLGGKVHFANPVSWRVAESSEIPDAGPERMIGIVEVDLAITWLETAANENTANQTAPSYTEGHAVTV